MPTGEGRDAFPAEESFLSWLSSSRLCILRIPNLGEIPPVEFSMLWAQVVSTWQIFPQILCLESEAKSIWRVESPIHDPIHQNIFPFTENEDYETQTFPDVLSSFPPNIPEQLFKYRRITIRISFVCFFFFNFIFTTGFCKQQGKKKSRSLDFVDIIASPGLNYHRSLLARIWPPIPSSTFAHFCKTYLKILLISFRTEGRKKRPPLNCTSRNMVCARFSTSLFTLLHKI